MKTLAKTIVVAGTVLLGASAQAEYKEIGPVSRIVKLGNLQKCDYRLVFKGSSNGEGVIRLPLNQSSTSRAVNRLEGAIDEEDVNDLMSIRLVTFEQIFGSVNALTGNERMISASLQLEDNLAYSPSVQAQLTTNVLNLGNGVMTWTGVPLASDQTFVEESCSSSRYAAKLRKGSKR